MSGIAAAKKRRAGTSATLPESPRLPNGGIAVSQTSNQTQGLTLQQVISLLDTRLTKVEKTLNEPTAVNVPVQERELLPSNISEILDDFQQRFIILAGEINSLKDTILKLQTYTMDVNKILLEERIQLISDTDEERFLLETPIVPPLNTNNISPPDNTLFNIDNINVDNIIFLQDTAESKDTDNINEKHVNLIDEEK